MTHVPSLRPLRRFARPALIFTAAAILFGGAAWFTDGRVTVHAAVMAGVEAVLAAGGYETFRWLRPRLGPWTGGAAVAVVFAAMFAALAVISPVCPSGAFQKRCTSAEVAAWGLNGLLLPVAAAVLVAVPVFGKRAVVTMWVRGHRLAGRMSASWKRRKAGKNR